MENKKKKRERIHEDGSFMHHQKGPITTTYTSDWILREGVTGRIQKDTGRMSKRNVGALPRPKEDTTGNYKQAFQLFR